MKRFQFNILLVLVIFCSSSCSDFIDLKSPTILRQDLFFKEQQDFDLAVNGMYGSLRGYYNDFYIVSDIISDNTEANGYNLNVLPMDQMIWFPSTSFIERRWTVSYSVIARANAIIQNAEGFDMDSELKMRYTGEAKFVRALMYFNAIQFYGDIPLVLTEIRDESEAYSYTKSPVQDIYEQIEMDLLESIDALPSIADNPETGRITKEAAQSLLGKVYITNKQFEKAVPVLESVVASNQYELLKDYASVFSTSNKNNKEIIFSVQYLGGAGYGEGSNFSISFAPFGSGAEITSGGNPSGANSGTFDLFQAFEPGDLRRAISIELYPSADSLYYTRKYLDRPIASNEGNNNWIVLRFSEVLLLLSEALNEIGSTGLAATELNKVRERAGLDDIATTDQGQLRDIIQQERRVELCFEGHRWFDLLRTGTMLSTMQAYQDQYNGSDKGYLTENYEITPNKVLFPIPFRELSLNPSLGQNPGY